MLENFDLVDKKLLYELDKNARISYSELGKRLKIAKETVKYRVERLIENKIIDGFYTVVNFPKLGFIIYRLYLRLQNTNPGVEKEITDYLLQSKNVAVFYFINGNYHIALGIWARDIWEYDAFWQGFKNYFGAYISSHHLSLMTEYSEFSREYLLPAKPSEKAFFPTISRTTVTNLEGIDFRMLNYISNNARASIVEIAKALNASIVTTRYHLKYMIDRKVILGFRPIFNLPALGVEYYKVDLWFKKFDKAKEISRHVISHPNVIYTERTLISSDLEFDVEIENFEKFTEMMDSFKAKFPEDIRDYTYYSLVKHYKTSYVPSL